jgi:predicted TIM-barrel fold metal-dependent hydrolase
MWLRHKYYSKFEGVLPSEIFRQNMYLCMIEEPVCLKYRDDIGIDKIMWECDYPHTDTVWPSSQASAQAVFDEAKCSTAEIEAITHGNAERVFNWQMAPADLATV